MELIALFPPLLIACLGIVFAITMVAPTRHLVAWLAMATILLLWPPGVGCSGVCGVGEVFAVVGLPLFGLAILIKSLITWSKPRPVRPANVAMRTTGVLAWLSLGVLLAQPLPAFRPDWLPPATATVAAAGLWLLFPWCASVCDWPASAQDFVSGLRWSSTLTGIAAASWYASTAMAAVFGIG